MTPEEILKYLADYNNWRLLRMWPFDKLYIVWVGDKSPHKLAKEALEQLNTNVKVVSITHNEEEKG